MVMASLLIPWCTIIIVVVLIAAAEPSTDCAIDVTAEEEQHEREDRTDQGRDYFADACNHTEYRGDPDGCRGSHAARALAAPAVQDHNCAEKPDAREQILDHARRRIEAARCVLHRRDQQ